MNSKFYNWAKKNDWKIIELQKPLPIEIFERYANIPKSWIEFINGYYSIINAEENIWFLTAKNFYSKMEDEWRYNEFELISLEAAEDDEDWQSDIKSFWNHHLPVVMSVKSGYKYYAIELNSGNIVSGIEPEFEETEMIAENFDAFLDRIMNNELF